MTFHSPELDEAIDVWAHDTHALLDACVALVSYFGTDEEDASIEKVAPTLNAWVDVVQRWREHPVAGFPWGHGCATFTIKTREVARVLSPLLEILLVPVPNLVGQARLVGNDAKAAIVLFGQCAGNISDHLGRPIWSTFPEFAPEGWPH
jgi:hypothetical protein